MFELEISAPADDDGQQVPESALRRLDATFESFGDFAAYSARCLTDSGVFLETAEQLPAGVAVRLEMALRGGATLIRALGQTAAPKDPEPPPAPGIEVRFTYLDPASEKVIDSVSRLAGGAAAAADAPTDAEAADAAAADAAAQTPAAIPMPPPGEPPPSPEDWSASEPPERSWELEVDSLLSEVLPKSDAATPSGGPPAAAAARPPEATLAEDGLPAGSEGWVQDFDPTQEISASVEEPAAEPLGDLPLRAQEEEQAGGETAGELLPPIELPAAEPPEVRLEGADEEDSLVLGFGESITMAPPRRRAVARPLLLVLAGVAALGLFLYLRSTGFVLPGFGPAGSPQQPAATVAELPPAAVENGREAPAAVTAGETPGAAAEPAPGAVEAPATGQPEATTAEPAAAAGDTPATAVEPPPATETPAAPAQRPAVAEPEPAAVASPPPPPAGAEPATAEVVEAVEAAVRAWAAAWSAQRIDEYLNCYGPRYSPPGLSRRDWEEQRRVRISAPARIEVEVTNFSIDLLSPSRARARFLQLYSTESRNLRARKIMELELGPAGWKIVNEQVDRG